ncbi:MAG TPA: DUF5916 domain-containing protein [Gemmatimonadaceae bacterium]|nr:DUF5916 domain-containing protein [Gemmatimonadaceae bacterium]
MHRTLGTLALFVLPCADLAAQGREPGPAAAARSANAASLTRTTATRATTAPTIDGRDDDEIWQRAQEVTSFRQFEPIEDGDPGMATMARFAYDDHNLYALVRAYDPHPDSIVALLSRRDVRTQSEQIKLIVDSYFDRRTGYEFAVNPAGVQRDYYIFDDMNEDGGWDAVWEAKTSIDSLGWIAEFRIPLSQLRFPSRDSHTFGIGVWRDVARTNERMSWPVWRKSVFGLSSQLGELAGISGIPTPRRLEVRPYVVQKSESRLSNGSWSQEPATSLGADLKYGVTSNLTLDAAINPDFGQVEADPSVLNLSAFEQFFDERRPFFTEGTGIFNFSTNCNDGECTGLFYSRRIGRAPQLGGLYQGEDALPLSATILGASKLTGRVGKGTSIGLLNAITQREEVGDATVEPQTLFLVGRVQQDFREGQSGVGVMLTGVRRSLDATTDDFLRREAYTGGVDFRHQFLGRHYVVSGYVVGSNVRGSADAIARTQRSSVHNYQRPDDDVAYDPARTSLRGSAMRIGLQKTGGERTRFQTGYSRASPGLEINDVGFQSAVDYQSVSNWFAILQQRPTGPFRRYQVNFNQWTEWTAGGTRTSLGGNINANAQFVNMWGGYAGFGMNAPSTCPRCTRGGPALRNSSSLNTWMGLNGDPRGMFIPSVNISGGRSDANRSSYLNLSVDVDGRFSSRFQMSVGASFARNIDDQQWYDNFGEFGSDTVHFTLANLNQKTLSMRARVDVTATPTLTVQFYAQPFVTSGKYSDLRELDRPRDRHYDQRLKPYTAVEPEAFNVKQFRSNTVLRWEYRPGSTLYLVWQQGRDQFDLDHGTFDVSRDYRNLFRAHPANTFLLKASYWFTL